jgi:hypothetical protein
MQGNCEQAPPGYPPVSSFAAQETQRMKSGNPGRPVRGLALGCAVAILPLGTLATLTACESEAQRIEHQDRDLVTDGFQKQPANTPERREILTRLPVNHFVQRIDGSTIFYVYSDPTVCNCIYVGTQRAYDNYKADRQSVVIYPYDGSTADWNAWGPWPAGN